MYDTLFLDRDGVINKKLEGRYVTNFSEFAFIEGSVQAIINLKSIFNKIVIVTNQQGVGKKIMSVEDLHLIHSMMEDAISTDVKYIDKIYFCSHLDSDCCNCRKPDIGMLLQAKNDFPDLNVTNSFLVGDSESDIQSGLKFGLKTIKVSDNYTLSNWTNSII